MMARRYMVAFALVWLFAAAKPALAQTKKVAINILVIEGSTTKGAFPKTLDDKIVKAMPGYQSAQLVDELNVNVEEGASVTLEIKGDAKPRRALRVTVREVLPDKTVKLTIAIEALKFSTETEHQKGGRLVIGHRLSPEKALFLAVTPTSN